MSRTTPTPSTPPGWRCSGGCTEALLLGCLGGPRLEHTLANLCTGLGLEQQGVRAVLQDERSRVTFLLPGQTRTYPREDYFYLSVFPLEGRAEGVCIRGAFYELTDAVLTAGYPLGVSNEYAPGSQAITLSVGRGALAVIETRADAPQPRSRRALSHSGPVLLIMEQNRKAVPRMKIVVLKSPRCLAGLLRLVFGIRNN